MAPTSVDQLGLVAENLLAAAETILGTTSAGVPAHTFIAAARPTWDCEFLSIQVALLGDDFTSPLEPLQTKLRNHYGELIIATFVTWVVRCGPEIRKLPPTDEAKTVNSLGVIQDGWALWNGYRSVQDEVFDGCLGVYFDNWVPEPEQGGYVGGTLTIRASVEGYTP